MIAEHNRVGRSPSVAIMQGVENMHIGGATPFSIQRLLTLTSFLFPTGHVKKSTRQGR